MAPPADEGAAPGDPDPARSEPDHELHRLDPLPTGLRFAFFVIGAVLVAIGLVGLALPVVPQVIPLVLGAAILSLASDALYRRLHRLLQPWPRLSKQFRKVRHRLHLFFSRGGTR